MLDRQDAGTKPKPSFLRELEMEPQERMELAKRTINNYKKGKARIKYVTPENREEEDEYGDDKKSNKPFPIHDKKKELWTRLKFMNKEWSRFYEEVREAIFNQ